MRFTPKSEHEIEAENLLPKGTYDFEVAKAEDGTSKRGNEMIKVALKVFAPNGGTPFVYDYLLEAFLSKLLNFCSCTGLMDRYSAGALTADDCWGKVGKVEIDIEPASGKFKAKNVVVDYVRKDDVNFDQTPMSGNTRRANLPTISQQAADMSDDDIPFNKPIYTKLWFC